MSDLREQVLDYAQRLEDAIEYPLDDIDAAVYNAFAAIANELRKLIEEVDYDA